jgi:hypothetical protein
MSNAPEVKLDLIEQIQQVYCPVVHDQLLRRILFNSAQMMKEG